MNVRDRGTAIVLAGILLFLGTLAVGAMTAPSLETTAEDNQNRTLVGIQGDGNLGWHKAGRVDMLNGSDRAWSIDQSENYFEVEQRDDGRIQAAFTTSDYASCREYDSPCTFTGYRVIDPQPEPTVETEYAFPVRSTKNSEVHAAEPLPDGGAVVADMDRERVFTVENGEITWQWNASSFYAAPSDPTKRDWLHINDVNVIEEDRYLISVRNANQLLVVDRDEGVVEVVNADDDGSDDESCTRGGQLADFDNSGGVRCGDPDVLDHQHNPHWLEDGAVLVADSDNDRIVELHRTEDGDWEPAWTIYSVDDLELGWPRDADRLPNGNTLITDTQNSRIVEVDDTGEVVWSTRVDGIPYEADRLPHAEKTQVPLHGQNETVVIGEGNSVPLLSDGVFLLRAAFPWVPFWYKELELGLTVVSVLCLLTGSVTRYRAPANSVEADEPTEDASADPASDSGDEETE